MPKIQPLELLESHYNIPYRHRHRCITDNGRAIRDAVTHLYRDFAQPTVTEHENGYIQVQWFSRRRKDLQPRVHILDATLPPDSAPDGKATVTCRVDRPQVTIAEHGQLTLVEMRPLVLEHSGHWKANDWQPAGFRKKDGPYLITISVDETAPEGIYTNNTVWRVYRHGQIVKEGKSYGWRQTMHIAEKERNEASRQDKHDQANASRYLAAMRVRPIHYRGESKPDGKPATLCGQTIRKKRPRVDGRHGADAEAPDANICAVCAEIRQCDEPN